MEPITLCTFQPIEVYDEILTNGIYRLDKNDFCTYTDIQNAYKHHHKLEKYERLMKKSGIDFHPNTMPIWGWHKDEFPTGFQTVAPHLYDGVFERARRHTIGEYKDFVGLFLEVPPDEVYLSNFIKWDFYLFSERNDDDIENFHNWTQEQQGWYLAEIAEAEYYFSQIDDIEGDVRVQGIFPEIRKDMIVQVLEESKTVSS